MAGVATVLAAYPAEVIEAALSPLSGIPAKFKFMPSIAELKTDLEARMPRWEPPTLAALLPAPPSGPRPSVDELRAKHGENWGLHPETHKRKSQVLSIGQLAAKYGVPRETVEAIPEGK